MRNIGELAEQFEDKLQKEAARGRKKAKKRQRTRNQINKDLGGQKKKYQESRKKLSELEKKRDRLERNINECRDSMRSSRSDMLNCTDVLKNMDLADCRHAIFYDNDTKDVSYIIDGSEQHIDIDDIGDVRFKPMKQYQLERLREDREKKRQDSPDSNVPADIGLSGDEEEEVMPADDGFDLNEAWDFGNIEDTPNFRIFD